MTEIVIDNETRNLFPELNTPNTAGSKMSMWGSHNFNMNKRENSTRVVPSAILNSGDNLTLNNEKLNFTHQASAPLFNLHPNSMAFLGPSNFNAKLSTSESPSSISHIQRL